MTQRDCPLIFFLLLEGYPLVYVVGRKPRYSDRAATLTPCPSPDPETPHSSIRYRRSSVVAAVRRRRPHNAIPTAELVLYVARVVGDSDPVANRRTVMAYGHRSWPATLLTIPSSLVTQFHAAAHLLRLHSSVVPLMMWAATLAPVCVNS